MLDTLITTTADYREIVMTRNMVIPTHPLDKITVYAGELISVLEEKKIRFKSSVVDDTVYQTHFSVNKGRETYTYNGSTEEFLKK